MRIKAGNELILLNLLVFALIAAIILFPSNILRIILSMPFLLFFPGYTLLAALFPSKEGIGGIERAALSLGLSIAIVPLMGLIFNYTPWGIRLESTLYSVATFILITSVIAWIRRKRLPEPKRFGIEFHLALPGWGTGIWDKVLSLILVFTVLGALGMMSYVIATPKEKVTYTEFYITVSEGWEAYFLRKLVVGEEVSMIVGIVNHEGETVNYRVEVRIDGVKNSGVEPIVLEHEGEWEEIVSFTPHKAGDKQKVEFLLYKQGQSEVLSDTSVWFCDVTE